MTDSMNPSTEDFAAMFEDSAGAATLQEGRVVPATVIANNGDYLTLDVGLKTEGRVPVKEFLLEEKQPEPGDIVEHNLTMPSVIGLVAIEKSIS